MPQTLTIKQQRIYDFIASSISDGGYCPSLREIGKRFRVSVGTAQEQTRALVAKGLLKRRGKGSARAFQLAETPAIGIPILGRVGAGGGVVAQGDLERHFTFDDLATGTDYFLRVQGDSMAQAGILEGDLVQVHMQEHAGDGDIVVAVVGEEEGVVKQLRTRDGSPRLESTNPKYAPILPPFKIIGAVVGLVRPSRGMTIRA